MVEAASASAICVRPRALRSAARRGPNDESSCFLRALGKNIHAARA